MTGVIARNWWYWRFYVRNYLADQKRQCHQFGIGAFLPHAPQPSRIPAADGWYCVRCGSRSARVQRIARGY